MNFWKTVLYLPVHYHCDWPYAFNLYKTSKPIKIASNRFNNHKVGGKLTGTCLGIVGFSLLA